MISGARGLDDVSMELILPPTWKPNTRRVGKISDFNKCLINLENSRPTGTA